MIENKAVWLHGQGQHPTVDRAPLPEPSENELLVRNKAVAVQPGEWKVQEGLIPIQLSYPAIIGGKYHHFVSLSGIVEKVGPGVERFKPGDRVACNSTGTVINNPRFGAYQRYTLVPQELTSKIGDTPFEKAAAIATAYGAFSALFLHLGLQRPDPRTVIHQREEKVLIWGVSSSFGVSAAHLATMAGYSVVGVASQKHAVLAKDIGIHSFVDRQSPSVVESLVALGPYKAVLGAADSADDQMKIGAVLAAQGGGEFLSTMGLRPGVMLPPGVTCSFHSFLDDYLKSENREFTEWVWWKFFEESFTGELIKTPPLEIIGGLSQVVEAWNNLKQGKGSGKRLIILPDRD